MCEIEKNIPIPDLDPGKNRKYPFNKMKLNDSFAVKVTVKNKKIIMNRLQSASCHYGKRHNNLFILRDLETEIRVWKIG